MINWGIIGLGNMAKKFATSIKEVKHSKLLAIASTNVLRLQKFGFKFNIEKKYRFNSYDGILNCNKIDAIYIATLNNTHHEIIIKAANMNKNVLCEKPATTNYDDTVKIIKKLNKSNIFFQEAIAYRSHKQTKFVLNKIKDEEIGELISIEANFGFVTKFNPKSRLFDPSLGGGAILDVGCYPVSFVNLIANLRYINIDVPEIIDVSGSISETGVDEIAYATLIFKKKIAAKIGIAIRLNMKNHTLIKGSKGNILINNPWLPQKKSTIEVNSKQSYYKSFINSELGIFANQINNVNKCILEGKKEADFPGMTWKDTLNNMFILGEWKKKLFKIKNEKNN